VGAAGEGAGNGALALRGKSCLPHAALPNAMAYSRPRINRMA
jgi:hypothetical protein